MADPERAVARTVVNRVAIARGLTAPWPETDVQLPGWLARSDLTGWGVVELGEMRLRLAARREVDRHGMVYTPPEVVGFMIRSVLPPARLDRVAGERRPLEHITVHDPYVGCGIFLIHAARHLTDWVLGLPHLDLPPHIPAEVRHAVTAQVMTECLYGTDLDPVAVDIAKAVCWLEIGGMRPADFMDRNVALGDTFANELPPALAERWPIDQPADLNTSAERPE